MLIPSIDIRLAGKSYDQHVIDVHVSIGILPSVGSARVNFPIEVAISAAVDDEASVILDSGEGSQATLNGSIRLLRKSLEGSSLVIADHSARLAAVRLAKTFEGQDSGKVIKALADTAGIDLATNDAKLALAVYVADQRHTVAEHISHLARLSGCLALLNADGKLDIRAWPGGTPDLALKHGREILTYQEDSVAIPAAARFTIGNGTAGSADAPDVLRPSFSYLPADASAPGADAIWQAAPEIRTASDAKAAGEAASLASAARGGRVHATTWLQPDLRPGMIVEVQDLPNGLKGGPWLLTNVRHSMAAEGAHTSFIGVNADAASALDGLLALAGAGLGGFL